MEQKIKYRYKMIKNKYNQKISHFLDIHQYFQQNKHNYFHLKVLLIFLMIFLPSLKN